VVQKVGAGQEAMPIIIGEEERPARTIWRKYRSNRWNRRLFIDPDGTTWTQRDLEEEYPSTSIVEGQGSGPNEPMPKVSLPKAEKPKKI
jgi:hypothetical protein